MKKVLFKCCLSGNVFYNKGDEVSLEDSEALRLKERGIVEILEEPKNEDKEAKNEDKKGKK